MKKINEMSEQEILSLTDNDLAVMVKIRMAEEGIKIIDAPKEPDYISIVGKDAKLFSVTGCDYCFEKIEDAEKMSSLLNELKYGVSKFGYEDYNYRYKKSFVENDYDFSNIGKIQTEEIYLKETYLKIKESIKANDRMKKAYEAEKKEYSESYEMTADIRSEIYDKHSEVATKYQTMELRKNQFKQYLELAQGNKDIAMSFLKKAYSINEETELFILNEGSHE